MKEFTKQTLHEIERRFKTEKGYVLTGENPIFCPQVNGITNICLAKLGFVKEVRENCIAFLKSPQFSAKSGLFHKEVDSNGRIISPVFNTCKNSVFALALALNGFKKEAGKIMNNLQGSPLLIKEKGLFGREFDFETGEVNDSIITQSNLWAALAFSSLGRIEEAKQIMKNLESIKFNPDWELFVSMDCRARSGESRTFVDDQALAILVNLRIGEKQKARELAKAVLNSPLSDSKSSLFNSSFSSEDVDTTKSSYKNSLMAIALNELEFFEELKGIQQGLVENLFDFKEKIFNQTTGDKTKMPDNSTLALVALELSPTDQQFFQ